MSASKAWKLQTAGRVSDQHREKMTSSLTGCGQDPRPGFSCKASSTEEHCIWEAAVMGALAV